MKVIEARTNGTNYQLHVHRSESPEILNDSNIERIMEECGILGYLTITGWRGIHFVVTTSNSPSMDKIILFCQEIQKITPIKV